MRTMTFNAQLIEYPEGGGKKIPAAKRQYRVWIDGIFKGVMSQDQTKEAHDRFVQRIAFDGTQDVTTIGGVIER